MPYESFVPQHQVMITEVVHDASTYAWMYVLHVQRGNTSTYSSPRGLIEEGFSHEYVIRRRFSEFKRLHAALLPIMGDALTSLPADGLLTLIMADDPGLLNERRQVLTQIVMDILNHPVARDLPDVLRFLGHETISAKVMVPLSSQCTGSIHKTSSPPWTTPWRVTVMSS
ncbi:putative Phox domain, PX domain superfamily, sorting nexin [Plasmopara halstedii]